MVHEDVRTEATMTVADYALFGFALGEVSPERRSIDEIRADLVEMVVNEKRKEEVARMRFASLGGVQREELLDRLSENDSAERAWWRQMLGANAQDPEVASA